MHASLTNTSTVQLLKLHGTSCASLWCHRTKYLGTMQISVLFRSQRDFISQKEALGKICPAKSILQTQGREKNTSIKPEKTFL